MKKPSCFERPSSRKAIPTSPIAVFLISLAISSIFGAMCWDWDGKEGMRFFYMEENEEGLFGMGDGEGRMQGGRGGGVDVVLNLEASMANKSKQHCHLV